MGLTLDLGLMMFLEIVRAKAQGPMGPGSCPVHIYNNRWNWEKLKLKFQIKVPILRHVS